MEKDAPTPSSPIKDDHKTKTLNLLLLRVKEKYAALQVDYEKQGKKLSDLETAHAKLQTQHMNLTSKSKITEEQLNQKLNAAIVAHQSDVEALNMKLSKLQSDMQRSASVMQSQLQDEICTLTSNLQYTQSNLTTSQSTLESERQRLGQLLTQTQNELKASRAEAEATLAELRQEREIRMRAQFTLSDKSKEYDTLLQRAKRLDDRCLELTDATTLARQLQTKTEQAGELWETKYWKMVQSRGEVKRHMMQYKLLLKCAAVSTYINNQRMKKLLLGVYEKVVQLCGEAITEPTNGGGGGMNINPISHSSTNSVPSRSDPSSPRMGIFQQLQSSASSNSDGHVSSSQSQSLPQQRVSPSTTYTSVSSTPTPAMGESKKVSPIAGIRAINENDSAKLMAARRSTAPLSVNFTLPISPLISSQPTASFSSSSSSPPSSISSAVAVASASAHALPSPTAAGVSGNMISLARYSVAPIGLTDREWAIHLADLASRTCIQLKTTNYEILQLIEDKLSILSPVVTELRNEVLTSRSTSEGMFQRTLQLSRKSMQVSNKLEREKSKTETLRLKLGMTQREMKRLRRIEYMYARLTEKEARPGMVGLSGTNPIGVGNGAGSSLSTGLDSLIIGDTNVASYAQPKGMSRRRYMTSMGDEADLYGSNHRSNSMEEKELSDAAAAAVAMATTFDEEDYLDSSESDEDENGQSGNEMTTSSAATTMWNSKRKSGVMSQSQSNANSGSSNRKSLASSALPSPNGSSISNSISKDKRSTRTDSSCPISPTASMTGSVHSNAPSKMSTVRTKFPPTVGTYANSNGSNSSRHSYPAPSVSTSISSTTVTPSPPLASTPPRRASAGKSSTRAVYVGVGSGGSGSIRSNEDSMGIAIEEERAVPPTGIRRLRNPYTISSRPSTSPHGHLPHQHHPPPLPSSSSDSQRIRRLGIESMGIPTSQFKSTPNVQTRYHTLNHHHHQPNAAPSPAPTGGTLSDSS